MINYTKRNLNLIVLFLTLIIFIFLNIVIFPFISNGSNNEYYPSREVYSQTIPISKATISDKQNLIPNLDIQENNLVKITDNLNEIQTNNQASEDQLMDNSSRPNEQTTENANTKPKENTKQQNETSQNLANNQEQINENTQQPTMQNNSNQNMQQQIIQNNNNQNTLQQTIQNSGNGETPNQTIQNNNGQNTTKKQTQRDVVKQNQTNKWRIQIPKINLDVHILEGTSSEVLLKAVGHFPETTKWKGNVGLAAHNRGYQCNFFEKIKNLKIGDEIIYTTTNGKKVYKVQTNKLIKDTDWSYLKETNDNRITLITCEANRKEYRRCVQAIEVIK